MDQFLYPKQMLFAWIVCVLLPNVWYHLLINGVKNGEIIISKVNEIFKILKILPRHCFIHNGQPYIIFFFLKYFRLKESGNQ